MIIFTAWNYLKCLGPYGWKGEQAYSFEGNIFGQEFHVAGYYIATEEAVSTAAYLRTEVQ